MTNTTSVPTLREYRAMIGELAQDPGVFDARDAAFRVVLESHGFERAERLDRRYGREVYGADD